MDVRPALIADAQPTELVQPGQRPLHHPPMDPQSTAVGGRTLRQDWLNSQGAQLSTMGFRAIRSVSLNLVWFTAGSAPLACHRRDSCYQGQQLGHVMVVSPSQNGGPGNSLGVRNHMVLTPRFAPVRGIGPRFSPHPRPLGRTHYPPQLGTNQSGRPLAVWTAKVHEASAKSQLPANHEDDASRSCPSRTPSPGVTSPRGCRSSGRTTLRSALAGCSKAFALESAVCEAWAAATKVELVPIVHHLPVVFPSASPPLSRRSYCQPRTKNKANSTQFVRGSKSIAPANSIYFRKKA